MLINIITSGIIAGIIMSVLAMGMQMLSFSQMNVIKYGGCLLTKKSSGPEAFVAGAMMHLVVSIMIAFIYFFAFKYLSVSGWKFGLLGGLIHWAISGMMLPLMDKMNSCVASGVIKPMKLYASGYGIGGIATFLIGHLVYGIVLGYLLVI